MADSLSVLSQSLWNSVTLLDDWEFVLANHGIVQIADAGHAAGSLAGRARCSKGRRKVFSSSEVDYGIGMLLSVRVAVLQDL